MKMIHVQFRFLATVLSVFLTACGGSAFQESLESSSSKARGSDDALEHPQGQPETTHHKGDDGADSESNSEQFDENLVALPPTVISGSYLTCLEPDSLDDMFSCQFTSNDGSVISLSDLSLKFSFKKDGSSVSEVIESRKHQDGNSVDLRNLNALGSGVLEIIAEDSHGGRTTMTVRIEDIVKKKVSSSDSPAPVITSEPEANPASEPTTPSQPTEVMPVSMIVDADLSSCEDLQSKNPMLSFKNVTKRTGNIVLAQGEFGVLDMSSVVQANLVLPADTAAKGLCIELNGISFLNLRINAMTEAIYFVGKGNSVANVEIDIANDGTTPFKGWLSGSSVLNVTGKSAACDQAVVTRSGNSRYNCQASLGNNTNDDDDDDDD